MGLRAFRSDWWCRPLGRVPTLLLGLTILTAPAWLMADSLRTFALFGDDFLYLADARDRPTLAAHLWEPHNTHVVPLFRLWTYALGQLAGAKDAWPRVFGAASYLGLVLAMLAIGHFVARETRRVADGLAAMALLGISTTIEPVVRWYAAGQALWSGTAVLLTLIAAQAWRARGGAGWLALAVLGALAAPLLWSGGLVAGPATAAYLAADGRRPGRWAAGLFLAVMAASAGFVLIQARGIMAETELIWEEHRELWPRPIQAILHTAQAIPEVLVCHNLGLDVVTSEAQGVVLTFALAATWAWTRRRAGWRPTPLEAAGVVIVLFSYLMAYFFRGNLPFSSLREVRWYHAVPHLGAVLFLVGWWTGRIEDVPGPPRLPSRRAAALVLVAVAALLMLHGPLYRRKAIAEAPPLTASERGLFPTVASRYARARALSGVHAAAQREALARLERAERIALEHKIGRGAIRAAVGHVDVPGMPDDREAYNAIDLLSLPESGVPAEPDRVRNLLGDLLAPRPEPRPSWLPSGESWPPPKRP